MWSWPSSPPVRWEPDQRGQEVKLPTPAMPNEKKKHDAAIRQLKLLSWQLYGRISDRGGLQAVRVEWVQALEIHVM